MIYLDTSVALAQVLGESRRPADDFWDAQMASSRLLQYELWTRVHARGLTRSHGELVRELTQRLYLLELSDEVLERALEPIPVPVRTLDAMHLSSLDYLRRIGVPVTLASYDDRLVAAARAMDFAIVPLE